MCTSQIAYTLYIYITKEAATSYPKTTPTPPKKKKKRKKKKKKTFLKDVNEFSMFTRNWGRQLSIVAIQFGLGKNTNKMIEKSKGKRNNAIKKKEKIGPKKGCTRKV